MISGRVNDRYEPKIPLSVAGPTGKSHRITALNDTGYSGFLTLPRAIIDLLDLEWQTTVWGTLANGSMIVFDVYSAIVDWDGSFRIVQLEAAESGPLVGMRLSAGHRVVAEITPDGTVDIQPL